MAPAKQPVYLRRNGIPAQTSNHRMFIMDQYGLIGYPLGHSFSQRFFTEKFAREGIAGARYDLFPLPDIRDFPALLAQHPGLRGLNVTLPHKITVLAYLHALDETALAVGAVNTIRIRNGILKGYNTDVVGFERSLQAWLEASPGRAPANALILGTGGAAKAVAWVLERMGVFYRFVSRNPTGTREIAYGQIPAQMTRVDLIVNATPLGAYPSVENGPDLPFSLINQRHLIYDLVYNPAETLLLRCAKARGALVKNGLEMLHLQAEAAWRIWQEP